MGEKYGVSQSNISRMIHDIKEFLESELSEFKEDYARHKPKKERHVSRYIVKTKESNDKKNKR